MLSAPTSTAPAASRRRTSTASRAAGAASRSIFEPASVGRRGDVEQVLHREGHAGERQRRAAARVRRSARRASAHARRARGEGVHARPRWRRCVQRLLHRGARPSACRRAPAGGDGAARSRSSSPAAHTGTNTAPDSSSTPSCTARISVGHRAASVEVQAITPGLCCGGDAQAERGGVGLHQGLDLALGVQRSPCASGLVRAAGSPAADGTSTCSPCTSFCMATSIVGWNSGTRGTSSKAIWTMSLHRRRRRSACSRRSARW